MMKKRHLLAPLLSCCMVLALCAGLSLEADAAACPPGWQGDYIWEESSPHVSGEMNMFWDSSIAINEENGRCQAWIEEDGYQTLTRVLADVQGDTNEIRLLFRKALEDDMNSANMYKPGETLLRLQRRGQEIVTHWGAMTANLEEHEKPGVYYKRTGNNKN